MPLYLIEPPSEPVITLEQAKAHLRVEDSDEDSLITSLVAAVSKLLDGRDGTLGRALVAQTWELKLDDFCRDAIRIPLPPLIELVSVKYYDADDIEQTVSPSIYQVIGVAGQGRASIVLREGQTWPDVGERREAVAVRFRAGYRDVGNSPPGDVPEPIIAAMKLMLGTLYENREEIVIGLNATPLPKAVEMLLAPYQVHHFS